MHFHCSYRGYGGSSGRPSERGLKLDAEAALRHVVARPDVDTTTIVLFGRSLGGAVAIHLAAKHEDKVSRPPTITRSSGNNWHLRESTLQKCGDNCAGLSGYLADTLP